MEAHSINLAIFCAGLPVCFVRLWLVWWRSACYGCGRQHRICECPPTSHTMRPR